MKTYINVIFFSNVHTKATEQLEKGKAWLAHTMKMLGMKPWNYVGFVVFPNINNRETLEETGLVQHGDKSKVKVDNFAYCD